WHPCLCLRLLRYPYPWLRRPSLWLRLPSPLLRLPHRLRRRPSGFCACPTKRRTPRRPAHGSRSSRAVLGGLADELFEQPCVVTRLGVPEHAEGEAPLGILEPLDRPVFGPGQGSEPGAEPAEALVVVRLDRRAVADQRPEHAVGVDVDLVLGEDAGNELVFLVADYVGQVLPGVPAEG